MSTAFQDLLIQMVREQDLAILDNISQCKNVLQSYTKDAFKRESRVFLLTLEAGCHRALLGAAESEGVKHKLIRQLQEEYGITPAVAEEAVSFLATMLKSQKGQTEESKISQLERAAQQGDYHAQYKLGLLFENMKKYDTAVYWLKAAAKQGLALYDQSQEESGSRGSEKRGKKPVALLDTFIQVKSGIFMMGSPLSENERQDNENPHPVKINSFYIGKHLVTQHEYEAVMGCNPSFFKGEKNPVESVSWYDAVEYCNKRSLQEGLIPVYSLNKSRNDPNNTNEFDGNKWSVNWNWSSNGYRLPTEAEWEYVCRAGTSTPYYTGANITAEQANYLGKQTSQQSTCPVGTYAPNPWGLYDMYGNVFEWCWDWLGTYSSGGTQTDPVGAAIGTHRVLRGGSWNKKAQSLRSAYRVGSTPSLRSSEFGFRLVRSGQ